MQFSADTLFQQNSYGHIRLEWSADHETTFELQRAQTAAFTDSLTIYTGPDRASFISGLENGTYYFRVRETGKEWSDIMTVLVEHQSLRLAFTLFTIGGIVFLLTVFVVVNGARRTAEVS